MANRKIYTPRFREEFVDGWPVYEGTFVDYCAARGVSRETGYEWLDRFRVEGLVGLQSKSSAPHVCPHATPPEVQELIVAARRLKKTWGSRKLRPWIAAQHPDVDLPAPSTMTDILRRHGLTDTRRRRKRTPPYTQPFAAITAPNDVWSIDFKGQFRTGDALYCYPLTLTDNFSRYLLRCDAYTSTSEVGARKSCEAAFRVSEDLSGTSPVRCPEGARSTVRNEPGLPSRRGLLGVGKAAGLKCPKGSRPFTAVGGNARGIGPRAPEAAYLVSGQRRPSRRSRMARASASGSGSQ